MRKRKDQFKFGIDFQELILQYIVTDKQGFKILIFIEDTYFTILYHQIIIYALKRYYKKNKNVPEEAYLREFLRSIYEREKIFNTTLSNDDKDQVSQIVTRIYSRGVTEPEEIISKCVDFARYVKFKQELESVDIENFDSYEQAIGRLKAANTIGIELQRNYGTFIVEGIKDRAYKRNSSNVINPTPFTQLNRLLNSGGLTRGSVICLMGKEKRFKTGMLINTAIGYLRMRKKGFYVDLENGEVAITVRTEQSLTNQTQEVIAGEFYEEKLAKLLRKYKRLGSELVVKRFPSLTTTCVDIGNWLDELKRDFDFVPEFGIIDYGVLLAANSGKMDEFGRISDAFLDIKNLAEERKLECMWTAAHITREGDKRTRSKYVSTDIAKCIDIPRHVDAVLGLQESEEETEENVIRLEVIEQRNGMREGNCLFWVNIPKQRLIEFNKVEIQKYREQAGESLSGVKIKKKRKSDL